MDEKDRHEEFLLNLRENRGPNGKEYSEYTMLLALVRYKENKEKNVQASLVNPEPRAAGATKTAPQAAGAKKNAPQAAGAKKKAAGAKKNAPQAAGTKKNAAGATKTAPQASGGKKHATQANVAPQPKKALDNDSFDRQYLRVVREGNDLRDLYKLGFVLELIRRKWALIRKLKAKKDIMCDEIEVANGELQVSLCGGSISAYAQASSAMYDLNYACLETNEDWRRLVDLYLASDISDRAQYLDTDQLGSLIFVEDEDPELIRFKDRVKDRLRQYSFTDTAASAPAPAPAPAPAFASTPVPTSLGQELLFYSILSRWRLDETFADLDALAISNHSCLGTCRRCRDYVLKGIREFRCKILVNVERRICDYIIKHIGDLVTASELLALGACYVEVIKFRVALVRILARHSVIYGPGFVEESTIEFMLIQELLQRVDNLPITNTTDLYAVKLVVLNEIQRYSTDLSFEDPDTSCSCHLYTSSCLKYLGVLQTWYMNMSYDPFAAVPSNEINGLKCFGRRFHKFYGQNFQGAIDSDDSNSHFHHWYDECNKQGFLVEKSGKGKFVVRYKKVEGLISEVTIGLLNEPIFSKGKLKSESLARNRANELMKYGVIASDHEEGFYADYVCSASRAVHFNGFRIFRGEDSWSVASFLMGGAHFH